MPPSRAIVTGGATNIGRAISEHFLQQGGQVVVGQPDPGVAAPLLEQYGDRVHALAVDVGDAAQCRSFVDEAAKLMGGLDVLVNNAAMTGGSVVSTLEGLDPAQFERMVQVNLGGAIFCSQAAVPHLRAAGGGVIVHISSINAVRPQNGALVYAATKAGVESITRSMAKELAPDGIRVVAVAPGDIQTAQIARNEAAQAAKGFVSEITGQTPLGAGEPADIAGTVGFLCSPQAKFVTGTTWLVDGGLLA
jgi:NAD(P)-dependent dehydrogenase (short-subunit alcohol dehydrogenase family)